MRVKPFLYTALLLAGTQANAQRTTGGADTLLKGSTIEVIQSYKPRVKQSPKPEWKPQLPPMDTTRPAISSDVPQQTLYYTYNSPPLRPLALGKNLNELPFANYVKLGGGNLSTIYADAGIGSLKGENYATGIHLSHISQKGKIENQQSSLTGLEAGISSRTKSSDWNAMLSGFHNRYYYYGYDHFFHNYSKESVSQAYTSVALSADLANLQDSSEALSYHPSLRASYYGARYNTNEISVALSAPVSYKMSEHFGLGLRLDGAFTNYSTSGTSTGNNYILAAPGVNFRIDEYYGGHVMGGIAYGKGGNIYFIPDAEVSLTMHDYLFKAAVGWKGDLIQNTYEQLTTENPYMASAYTIAQTKRDEIYAMVQGSVGHSFSYSGRASWWNYNNLATYLNDTGDQKTFYIRYQDVQALSFQASARYHSGSKYSAGVTGEMYSFYQKTDAYVWHEPATRFKADVRAAIVPKLDMSLYATLLTGIHARDALGTYITLKPATDIGISAEYAILSRLNAFVQVNNLLNNKYQRWLGYQVYGINIYGGVRLKF